MNMPSKDMMTAIGTIATAMTLVITVWFYYSDLQRSSAEEIRRELLTYAQESQSLIGPLNDGSTLIAGAASITEELQKRLGPAATADDFWRIFANNQTMLSVVTVGWHESKLSRRLDAILDSHRRASFPFTGHLSLLRYPSQLYADIIRDAYSPMIFSRLFFDPDIKPLLVKELQNEKSLRVLLRKFSIELHGNVALYYRARYENAAKKIDDFIQKATQSFIQLSDEDLVGLSRTSVSSAKSYDTRTASMLHLLDDMRSTLGEQKHEELSSIVKEIGDEISKETASEKLSKG